MGTHSVVGVFPLAELPVEYRHVPAAGGTGLNELRVVRGETARMETTEKK